jgi:hypothetical protein
MSGTRWTAVVGLALMIATLPAAAGCSRKAKEDRAEALAEEMLSKATGKKVDLDANGKEVRIEGEGVKTSIADATEWPADIFASVPEFTFGKVERVSKTEDGPKRTFNVYLHEIEPGGIDRYAELLERGGWKVDRMGLGEKGGMLNGQKDDLGMNFTYSLERQDGMLAVFTVSP